MDIIAILYLTTIFLLVGLVFYFWGWREAKRESSLSPIFLWGLLLPVPLFLFGVWPVWSRVTHGARAPTITFEGFIALDNGIPRYDGDITLILRPQSRAGDFNFVQIVDDNQYNCKRRSLYYRIFPGGWSSSESRTYPSMAAYNEIDEATLPRGLGDRVHIPYRDLARHPDVTY
jgi:hypothetical protein